MHDWILIGVIAAASLTVSFFCSLLESCLYSVSRSRIETLVRAGDRRGAILLHLREHIDESIAAILVCNTIANIIGAVWVGALVTEHFGSSVLGVSSAVFTACVLFFGEITPKSIGFRHAAALAPALAVTLRCLVWALWPLVKLCVFVTRIWGKDAHISHGTAEDIVSLAHLVERQGGIEPYEVEWVANALRLDTVSARDLMTPELVVARVPAETRLRETKVDAEHWRFSRLPVCASPNPNEIVGVVHRRKVFEALARDQFDVTIADLMEKAEFVAENMPAHQLLDLFLKRRRHLFCVKNENGVFTGVVTLEDVLESLLGREIVDEKDLHEDMQVLARRRRAALPVVRAKPIPPKP